MSLINISGLTFAYEGSYDNIFENVSFQLDTDWKLGFTGRNGRGKTTFLKLLMGQYEYSGSISSSVEFDYFPFEVADKELNTGDIIEQLIPDCESWRIYKELSLLEVSQNTLYRPFYTLSNGEQTKILLAALFLKSSNFLLIDEPTNHLDMEAREIVGNYLNGKKGFILVSHDRTFLDKCVDHILSINKTNIEIQQGNFSSWWANKQLQDNFELAQNEKLKKDIKRLSAAAKRTEEWSDKAESTKIGFNPDEKEKSIGKRAYVGEKARKMMKRSKSIAQRQQNAIEEKSQLLKNIEAASELKIHPLKHYSDRLIEISVVSIFYGEKQVCNNAAFTLNTGEKIALCGKNGCGKSSLLKLIIGENITHSGVIKAASGLIISYVPQDTSFLKGNLSEYAEENHIDESMFKTLLRKLDFSRIQFEKDMSEYSGGQKKKVLIAKSLCQQAHLYVWDEPLNFIDILSRMQIESLILEYNPTMIFVEHDKHFIENVATKCINLS